jgi:SAM-dependent methyltransferase
MFECRICANSNNIREFIAKEKMYGTGDEFLYFECSQCGCLQIAELPDNLSQYYSSGYRSLFNPNSNPLKKYLKRKWYQNALGNQNIIGNYIYKKKGTPYFIDWLKETKVKYGEKILDIGSGSGQLLFDLYEAGFKDLTGLDIHIEKDLFYNNNVRILKKPVEQIENKFDFIMLHHSFEHIPNPVEILQNIHRILNNNKYLLIRIPLADCFAWKKYGIDWVQLDAPRHLFLHTIKSMNILAEKTRFQIEKVNYDSGGFQFWGSILFQHNIPLTATKLFSNDPTVDFPDIFKPGDFQKFEEESILLNEKREGDQAVFYLKKD